VNAFRFPRSAVLLLGPTGSGKTPLGDYLEHHGIAGRRCFHFDFGVTLRKAAAGESPAFLSDGDMATVRQVLASGALLEDHEFPIATKLLRAFLARRRIAKSDIVVLNGLPRHKGQARDIEGLVKAVLVVYLHCSAEVVRERIRLNAGEDRTERVDDSPGEVDNKLRIFEKRTAPLLDYYRGKGVGVLEIEIMSATTAADVAGQVECVIKEDERFQRF